jgi:hypothetical protein
MERVWERGEVYTGFWLGKRDGTKSLGRPRHRWEDNIKMGIQEVERGDMDWIELAQDRAHVNVVMNLRVP